jgi:hypothetical protein
VTLPRAFHEKDLRALIDAFKAGLVFDPPAMSANELRANMRKVGLDLNDPDELEAPRFEFPEDPDYFEHNTEEDNDGNEPAPA